MSILGKPKYKINDTVNFILGEEKKEGIIAIVDSYGTFEFPETVCYDILACDDKYKTITNPLGKCLYKHIKEEEIVET